MLDAIKYIKKLEGIGFSREQAEAHVQIAQEVIVNELTSKEHIDQVMLRFEKKMSELELRFENKMTDLEMRMLTKTGWMFVTACTLIIAVLGWLIKSN